MVPSMLSVPMNIKNAVETMKKPAANVEIMHLYLFCVF